MFLSLFSCDDQGVNLTISLAASGSSTLTNLALVLQVEVPALLLALGVLHVESDDGLGAVDGLLATSLIALEGLLDHVERGGGGVGICGSWLAVCLECRGWGAQSPELTLLESHCVCVRRYGR